MAINDKHGKPTDELDFGFDDGGFDDLTGFGADDVDDRSPKGKLKKFASTLKEEALSPSARRQYLHDALPQNYHSTLNAVESISDAASDLYNDSIMTEWDKSRNVLKRAIRADGDKLRRFKLGRIVDWADQKDDDYRSDYNPEEMEVQRSMGTWGGDLKSAMNGGNLSPQERREFLNASKSEEELKEVDVENEQTYKDTTVRQQTATVSLLNRILESQQRQVDYQDQIDFNYKKKQIEFGIRSLIGQRKALEQQALLRAEMKEGLAAIAKNTGLPDYVKITAQENAKRLMRDKMVNAASDWASSKLSGTMRAFMDQTKRNIASMGMSFREKAGMYVDGKEMLDGVGMSGSDIAMSMVASLLRAQASKRGGKYIRDWISKNPKYTKGLDLTEAILANAGSYMNMAMDGRSGYGKLDRLLERGGYSGLAQQQNYKLGKSNAHGQDEAAFMDRKLRTTFLDVYPAWFAKIWKSIEGMRRGEDPSKVEDLHYDTKFNRLRDRRDMQKEFDNETVDDHRVKAYNDGIDNWINRLDPKGSFTPAARDTIRRWLINNHAAGKESFPVTLFRGEGLPRGTTREVRRELEDKVPTLAGFDPIKVSMIMDEGVGLELKALRQNPEYRRVSKALGNADAQARSRHPVDNRKLAAMTERYGHNFAVDSGLAKYDREGNVVVDNENIVKMVSGGGNRIYHQRGEMQYDGSVTPIEGVDQGIMGSDKNRTPIRRMGKGTDRKNYDQWTKAVLSNMNINRLPGFAKGGFTSGDPDKVSGVTHGDEAVIDSTGTKNNKTLLSGIMKLGAPVIKNGRLNRTYYRYLGFTSPEQVDALNKFTDVDKLKEFTNEKVKSAQDKFREAKERFRTLQRDNLHRDGYIRDHGPVPEFMGPVRKGGMRNKLGEWNDLARDPEELMRRADVKTRLKNAQERLGNITKEDVINTANDYKTRARDAVRKANTSGQIDPDATRTAIDKAIREKRYKGSELISLFLEGMSSPFMTKGDFATGRFSNKSTGEIIYKLEDIMDDIVMVNEYGDMTTIATMADMLEGVFDSRGNQVELPGLTEGYRKYIKRTTMLSRQFRNSRFVQTIKGLKEKLWDDHPVDVCIVVGGHIVTVMKASGFIAGQYLDADTLDVLKSHNDIQGAVINSAGETILTLEELANGIFGSDGERLTISHMKHLRNKIVGKIETVVGKQVKLVKEKIAGKLLNFLEGTEDRDVYVMRWVGKARELTKAFEFADLESGILIDSRNSTVIKKIGDIVNPVYSTRTKSIVVKDDELAIGLFNSKGDPYKDFRHMTLGERIKHQQDRAYNALVNKASGFMAKMKAAKAAATEGNEITTNINDGDKPMDVYIMSKGVPKLVLNEQGFRDLAYKDSASNWIRKPNEIYMSVFSAAGRILLTEEQIAAGLFDANGVLINTKYKEHASNKIRTGGGKGGMLQKLKTKLGFGGSKDEKVIDVYSGVDGNLKRLLTKNGFMSGQYRTTTGEILKSHEGIDGPIYDSRGKVLITLEDLQNGLFDEFGTPLKTAFSSDNGKKGGKKPGLLGRVGNFIGSKFKDLRENSWQWKQAKKEEAERNKKGDVIVNVEDKDKKEKGFLGRMLMGLGTMFGGMFTKMMMKFGRMFKSVRNAIMLSKMASAAGGVLGGGVGGGRGKLGLLTKLAGGALAAGGAYTAYNAFGDATNELMDGDPSMGETPEEQQMMAQALAAEDPGMLSSLWNGANDATGGLAGEIATTAALGYGAGKIGDMRRARRLNAARPGLASRFGNMAGKAASSTAGALGRGVGDAGRATAATGRLAGKVGRFAGGKAGLAKRIVGGLANGATKAAKWAFSPKAAAGRFGNIAKAGSMALKAGRFAFGALRVLSGPVGWGLMAATWVGGKLWDRYKAAKNPLMRFRIAQYGFDFDDEATTSKLLDLENLMKDYVVVNGEGKPSIKDNMPEEQIFQLFEIDPNDQANQEHIQRFVAWWVKRFKPVYLSYIKQAKLLINKTDLATLDDELGKKDKLALVKGVNFTNSQNNPYLVSASPFGDPAETPLTIGDVEKAYEKCLKFINKMPDDSKTEVKKEDGEEVKTGEEKSKEESKGSFSWLDNTKDAIKTLAEDTLQVTKVLAKKTDEVFGGWFSEATDNVKGLWDGASKWLTNATKALADKIKAGWESIKNLGSTVVDGAVSGAGAVAQTVGGAANAAYDGVVGTYEKLTGKTADTQMMVYKGFLNAGLSDGQARILTSEVGRENDYQTRYIFGGHVDANNGAQNLGMISWQKARASKLAARLKQKGLIDAKGNMVHSQAAIDEQAKFLVEEIKTDPSYKRTKDVFLSNPNVSYQAGVEVLGRNFIRWDYDGKKINPAAHHKKRDKYYGQITQQVRPGSGTPPTGTAMKSGQIPSATAGGPPPVKPGQTQVTNAEMKKLSTAAPKPATPLGPAAMEKWEKDEAARKKKLEATRKGILAGTHILSDKPVVNDKKLPEPSTTKAQQAKANNGSQGGTAAPSNGKNPPWMDVALQELNRGVGENKDLARANQYFAELGYPNYRANKQSWCAAFVSWCLKQSGTPYNQQNALSAKGGYAGWGKKLSKDNIPYGAIVVIDPSHVFFAAGVENGRVRGLGGNQGKPGEVKYSNFPLSSVISVTWPDGTSVAAGNQSKPTPSTYNNPVQSQQASQQQNASYETDANASRLSEPNSRTIQSTANYQTAQQQAPQNQTATRDAEVRDLQLSESKAQTKLLTEIKDVLTGQRSDHSSMGDRSSNALSSVGKAQQAQAELIATSVGMMVTALKDLKKSGKSEKLSDQFPISAAK